MPQDIEIEAAAGGTGDCDVRDERHEKEEVGNTTEVMNLLGPWSELL